MLYIPSKMMFELSSVCNYRCVGCPNQTLERGHGHMPSSVLFDAFEEVGDQLHKAFLWLYGEPLLNPNIEEMLQGIRKYKAKRILSTNGWKIPDFKDLAFLTGLDVLIISINGITQASYAAHQQGGNLERVLMAARRVGNELRGSRTVLSLQTVVHRENLGDIQRIRDFASESGFDEFVLKSFNVMDGSTETFRSFVPTGTEYSRYEPSAVGAAKQTMDYACLSGAAVGFNGDVYPCCWDYRGRVILGNLNNDSLIALWNSDKSREFRNRIMQGRFSDICSDCTNEVRVISKDVFTEKERSQNAK